jgi:hypothetical protein
MAAWRQPQASQDAPGVTGQRKTILASDQWDGPSFDTCAASARVARDFEICRRPQDLTFRHHREVAGRPIDTADARLDRCEETIKITENPSQRGNCGTARSFFPQARSFICNRRGYCMGTSSCVIWTATKKKGMESSAMRPRLRSTREFVFRNRLHGRDELLEDAKRLSRLSAVYMCGVNRAECVAHPRACATRSRCRFIERAFNSR